MFFHKMHSDHVFSSLIYPNPPHLTKLPTPNFLFLSVLKTNKQIKEAHKKEEKIKQRNKEKRACQNIKSKIIILTTKVEKKAKQSLKTQNIALDFVLCWESIAGLGPTLQWDL